MASDLEAEHVERRLDRDRVRRDLEELVRGREGCVDLARPLQISTTRRRDLLGDLRSDDVRVDAHAADPTQLEERLDESVVTRVQVEPGRDDVPRLVEIVVRLL